MKTRRPVLFLALALLTPLAGCEESATGPHLEPTAVLVSDAAAGWAFVELGSPAATVVVTDAAASASWDVAFNATSVMLNGGSKGPGGVVAYCLCQNAGATNEQHLAMTPDSELAEFEAVQAAQIPEATAAGWSAEVFESSRWYRYNLTGTHQVTPTYEVYLVKRGSDVYKVQLIGYYGADGKARQITMRYARLAS